MRGQDLNLQPPGYEPDELPIALPRDMVPETGIEPARDHSHGILSPGRLPIPPLRHGWLRSLRNIQRSYRIAHFPSHVKHKFSPDFGLCVCLFQGAARDGFSSATRELSYDAPLTLKRISPMWPALYVGSSSGHFRLAQRLCFGYTRIILRI